MNWISKMLKWMDHILQIICAHLPKKLQSLIHRWHRLLTYAFMGCLNTVVDYAIYAVLYYALGVTVSIAQFAGTYCGSTCGYYLNSSFTFAEGKGRSRGQYWQYVGVDIVLAVLSGAFMEWAEVNVPVPMLLIKVAMSILILVVHYVVYKKLVFRIKKEDDEEK